MYLQISCSRPSHLARLASAISKWLCYFPFVIFHSCIYTILYNFWARMRIVVLLLLLLLLLHIKTLFPLHRPSPPPLPQPSVNNRPLMCFSFTDCRNKQLDQIPPTLPRYLGEILMYIPLEKNLIKSGNLLN